MQRQLKREQDAQDELVLQAAIKEVKSAIINSGSTINLNQISDELEPTGVSNKCIVVATGEESRTTHTALLPMRQLRQAARETHILPELTPNSLLSVKQLADNGYTTIFHPHERGVTVHDGHDITFTLKNAAVLQGWRDERGLWRVPLTEEVTNATQQSVALDRPIPSEAVHNVYELPSTSQIIAFHHASLGFPTKATLLEAVRRGFLTTFPDLTTENVNNLYPESVETQKGHMRQSKQGVRSTKIVDEEFKPPPGTKQKDVYLRVFDATKRSMYSDQMGRFPITSHKGSKYMMVAVELDGNYIDVETM